MEKLDDKKDYKQPTREALVRSIFSDGIYSAKCRKCGQIVRGISIKQIQEHVCQN